MYRQAHNNPMALTVDLIWPLNLHTLSILWESTTLLEELGFNGQSVEVGPTNRSTFCASSDSFHDLMVRIKFTWIGLLRLLALTTIQITHLPLLWAYKKTELQITLFTSEFVYLLVIRFRKKEKSHKWHDFTFEMDLHIFWWCSK